MSTVLGIARSLGVALSGVVLALALSEARLYLRARRRGGPRRLVYMALVRLGIAMAGLFMAGALAQRLANPELTWRLPVGMVAYVLLIVGMWGILVDDESIWNTGRRWGDPPPAEELEEDVER